MVRHLELTEGDRLYGWPRNWNTVRALYQRGMVEITERRDVLITDVGRAALAAHRNLGQARQGAGEAE